MGRPGATHRLNAEPLCRVVRFAATDGVELSGLLYEPARHVHRSAAIFLHGTGGASVFESNRTNLLAAELTAAGIAYFPFNNRGAHMIRRLRARRGGRARSVAGGMAFERIRDCVFDIDGAVRELRRRGYGDLTLIGHSTGANKVAVYDFYKPRVSVARYVLLGGGDDSGLACEHLGVARFRAALQRARERIHAGRGEEIVPSSLSPMQPISWRSYYDMANPDGDYNVFPFYEILRGVRLSRKPRFRHLRGIRKPTLILYGDRDEYCYGDVSRCVAILSEALGPRPNFELAIMKDADHGFSGKENELGELIAKWIGEAPMGPMGPLR